MASNHDENVGIAFALVIGAGLSTALGAAVVFVPWLVKYASRRTLAGALGLSAGVMTYVSFVEIFGKSSAAFEDAGMDEDHAYVYATACFFGGVVLMVALNYIVTFLLGGHHHHNHNTNFPTEDNEKNTRPATNDSEIPTQPEPSEPVGTKESKDEDLADTKVSCPCCSDDPVGDLEKVQRIAEEIQTRQQDCSHEEGQSTDCDENHDEDHHHLMRMSINTAVAIGLHNFPEGLATFVATLADPSVGFVLAIAIAIHNIPEGLCVAMPIYYATGNRWKAFMWALFSGVAEPIAALLGWVVLANSFSDRTYAILFGIVSGMMVIISARELLPTAHRYDPEDSVVTYSFMLGMAIMALSLVLFVL